MTELWLGDLKGCGIAYNVGELRVVDGGKNRWRYGLDVVRAK